MLRRTAPGACLNPILKVVVPPDPNPLRQLVHYGEAPTIPAHDGVGTLVHVHQHHIRASNFCQLEIRDIRVIPDRRSQHIGTFELLLDREPRFRGHRIGCLVIQLLQPNQRATEVVATCTMQHRLKPFIHFRHDPLDSDLLDVFHRFVNELDFPEVFIRERNR